MKHTMVFLWEQERESQETGKMELTGNGILNVRGEDDGIDIRIELNPNQLENIVHVAKCIIAKRK
jgi:hypothetical protein